MSGIVLSAATRSSLLSAQDTASLLAQTQNRLATGKKVTSALDNPTNFFTASGLTSLLDGISNGIQTIQAASTGITSIQKLVDTAKSIANQALSDKSVASNGAPATNAVLTSGLSIGSSTFDFSTAGAVATFSLTVDQSDGAATPANSAGAASTITLNKASLAGVAKDINNVTAAEVVTAINNQINNDGTTNGAKGRAQASLTGDGRITFTSTDASSFAKITLATAANNTRDIGFGATTTAVTSTAQGTNATANTVTNTNRQNYAKQFNDILTQIDKLAGDASYNGVNLLNDGSATNKLTIAFNEKSTASIDVKGQNATSTGLGFAQLTTTGNSGFQTDAEINLALSKVGTATNTLRQQASQLGSNLTVVQARQDFTKNLVNVLQTGSANLVNADLNEEAANSQALSTRQSLAISALSLANTAQQGVLQLLR
jgi:flagellin